MEPTPKNIPTLTRSAREHWEFIPDLDVALIDDVSHLVTANTERTLYGDPRFRRQARTPVDPQAVATIPSVVRHTFDAVALELLRGNQYALRPEFQNAIHRQVFQRVNNELVLRGKGNPWYLPFGGRVLKLVVRVACQLALGWLRIQFPAVAVGEAAIVATALQRLVDRKPVT